MNNIKRELLKNYIKANIAPILVDFIEGKDIPNSVLLPSTCKISELNGLYIDYEYVSPKWFEEIEKNKNIHILVIDKIDNIDKEEQRKFIEILEYRKISTFELPNNIVIIITANKINKDTINEEIYSLVAHIEG